jgi:hypothetical protein
MEQKVTQSKLDKQDSVKRTKQSESKRLRIVEDEEWDKQQRILSKLAFATVNLLTERGLLKWSCGDGCWEASMSVRVGVFANGVHEIGGCGGGDTRAFELDVDDYNEVIGVVCRSFLKK